MIIERGCGILHNCNKKRRLEAPSTETGVACRSFAILMLRPDGSGRWVQATLSPANLGRLPMHLVLQALHLVFEAQL
jgi:hypothetical protein